MENPDRHTTSGYWDTNTLTRSINRYVNYINMPGDTQRDKDIVSSKASSING
jgi:hypothetical protein